MSAHNQALGPRALCVPCHDRDSKISRSRYLRRCRFQVASRVKAEQSSEDRIRTVGDQLLLPNFPSWVSEPTYMRSSLCLIPDLENRCHLSDGGILRRATLIVTNACCGGNWERWGGEGERGNEDALKWLLGRRRGGGLRKRRKRRESAHTAQSLALSFDACPPDL